MESPNTPPATTRPSLLEYIEGNPVAAVFQGLAIGFAVGMLIRLLDRASSKPKEIDVRHKPSLDEAKFHLGSVLLPYLWPAWKKAQTGYEKSTDSVRDALEKLKKSDLPAEGKKKLKEAEKRIMEAAQHLKEAEAWAGEEAGRLTSLGKEKAKDVEKWVEDEILPAAECGWKKLRALFR